MVDQAWNAFGGLDIALIGHGVLPDQARCQVSAEEAVQAIEVNFLSAVACSPRWPTGSRRGARLHRGDHVRGRRPGAAEQLRVRRIQGRPGPVPRGAAEPAASHGVAVVTLKPGFVDTPMTAGMKQGPLFVSARRAGRAVHRAIERRRDIAYIPWFWRPIMGIIRALPETVFKRLRL